jgi:hypothetical protein
MRSLVFLCVLCGMALAAASVQAAPIVDGVRSVGEYGAAVAVQTVETQFGDNFSELDAAYASVDGARPTT